MRLRIAVVLLVTASAMLAFSGSASALKLIRVQGHVLNVPVSCEIAVADPETYDPVSLASPVPTPNCRIGEAVDCRHEVTSSTFPFVQSTTEGCTFAAGPATAGCDQASVNYGFASSFERGCRVSLDLGDGQGASIACTSSDASSGQLHYSTVSYDGCGGALAAGGVNAELICEQRETGSFGGGSFTTSHAACGLPSHSTGCTRDGYSSSFTGGHADTTTCTFPPVATLTCEDRFEWAYPMPIDRDECLAVVDLPLGPSCSLAVVGIHRDPTTARVDTARTGCA